MENGEHISSPEYPVRVGHIPVRVGQIPAKVVGRAGHLPAMLFGRAGNYEKAIGMLS